MTDSSDATISHTSTAGQNLDHAAHADHSESSSGFAHEVARAESRDLAFQSHASPTIKPTARGDLIDAAGGNRVHDITARFTAATSALQIGQLIKDEEFTLFESVGALEIMDPKMDSGFLQPGETLEDEYDTLRPLSPEEVIWIIDQLLCSEMAWHHGYPLSQTLFTSIYIDKLLWPTPFNEEELDFHRGDRPVEASTMVSILRAYCAGLIKSCGLVIKQISSRDFYEEEDFSTHTFHRSLLDAFRTDDIIDLLNDTLDQIKVLQSRSPAAAQSSSALDGIFTRFLFRRDYLLATSTDLTIQDTASAWKDVTQSLTLLSSTSNLGRPVEASFSFKLQRKLASTVPPRPIVKFTFDDAYAKFLQLIADCSEAARIQSIEKHSPRQYLQLIWSFGSRKPAPLAYARSCVSTVFMSRSNEEFEDLLLQDLGELVLPADHILDPVNWTIDAPRNPVVAKDKRLWFAEIVSDFSNKALPEYYDVWNSLCQNRSRTRRILSNALSRLDELQHVTESLDEELHSITQPELAYSLSTWVYHFKLCCMEWVVQLGFEQEIYLPNELSGMYLWLSEISKNRSELLQRIRRALQQKHVNLTRSRQFIQAETVLETSNHVQSLYHEAKGTESFAEALHVLYMFLNYAKLVPMPARPYNDPALRYEVRMRDFLPVTSPEVPSYDRFERNTQVYGSWTDVSRDQLRSCFAEYDVAELLKLAKAEWSACKRLGAKAAKSQCVEDTWDKNIASMLQSCIAAGLVHTAVYTVAQQNDARPIASQLKVELPEVGQRYHDWWIVPKVTKLE